MHTMKEHLLLTGRSQRIHPLTTVKLRVARAESNGIPVLNVKVGVWDASTRACYTSCPSLHTVCELQSVNTVTMGSVRELIFHHPHSQGTNRRSDT
jgi:hypothetical protein